MDKIGDRIADPEFPDKILENEKSGKIEDRSP
jgi:hypothetical protein